MARRKYLSALPLVAVVLAFAAAAALGAKALRSQVITFTSTAPTNAAIGGATYTVTATGGESKNPVLLTIDSASKAVCTLSGDTSGSKVSFQAAGTCTIDANQAGGGEYEAAPQVQQSFTVHKKTQTITIAPAVPTQAFVGATYTSQATASSGLPVVINTGETPSVCSTSGSTVTFKATGSCQIDFNQSGSSEYEAAPEQKTHVEVIKRSQTVTITSKPPSPALAGESYKLEASASSGLSVTYSSATESVCSVSEATVALTHEGECKLEAHQAGSNEYEPATSSPQQFAVARKTQTISFKSTPPSPAQVGATYNVEASASSGLPVALSAGPGTVCTLSGTTVKFAGAGTCTVEAKQEGNSEYSSAKAATQTITVETKPQTITFKSSPPNPAQVGGAYKVEATASSGLPVALSAGPGSVCTLSGTTVSFVGKGTCTVEAKQEGNSEYGPAKAATQTINVETKSQTVSFRFTAPGTAQVGATYNAEASASSGLPVTVSGGPGAVCTLSGTTVSFIGKGTCTVEAKQTGNGEYGAANAAPQTIAVEPRSQTVSFTSAAPNPGLVGGTYSPAASASSGLGATFASATPSVCTVSGSAVSMVASGTCTLVASVAETSEWAAAQAQQSFTVYLPVTPPPTTPPPPPPPIVQVKPVVVPNSNFKVLGASLSLATYAITFVEDVSDPGTFSWLLTFQNGKFGVYSASTKAKKCKAGWIRLKGRCRPAKVLFARGSEKVANAGSVTFTVKPTRAGVSALRKAFKENRGLPVIAYVTFQSARGGAPVARVQSLIVKGRR